MKQGRLQDQPWNVELIGTCTHVTEKQAGNIIITEAILKHSREGSGKYAGRTFENMAQVTAFGESATKLAAQLGKPTRIIGAVTCREYNGKYYSGIKAIAISDYAPDEAQLTDNVPAGDIPF